MDKPLKNNKHELFCQNIVQGQNQTEAYINAGYSCGADTAKVKASVLVTNGNVKKRIEYLQKTLSDKNIELSSDFIKKEIAKVMKSCKVPNTEDIDDKTAFLKALDMLNKMGGNYSEKRILEGGDKPVNTRLEIEFVE